MNVSLTNCEKQCELCFDSFLNVSYSFLLFEPSWSSVLAYLRVRIHRVNGDLLALEWRADTRKVFGSAFERCRTTETCRWTQPEHLSNQFYSHVLAELSLYCTVQNHLVNVGIYVEEMLIMRGESWRGTGLDLHDKTWRHMIWWPLTLSVTSSQEIWNRNRRSSKEYDCTTCIKILVL